MHFYAQCEAIRTFEDASDGLFLTYAGIDDDGVATSNPVIRVPADPLTQLDGTFEVDSGSVDSMRANPSGGPADYKPGVTTLINDSSSSLLQRITYMTGRLDGQFQDGQVTYLAGHDYAVDLPITSNPQTNGVRLFLDALLKSDCAATTAQPDLTLTKTAPALTAASEIPYTITLGNPLSATAPAENVVVTDAIPAGTTYVAGSGSTAPTTNSGGVLTWNLPPLAPGASTTITFRVSVTSDGAYLNTAYADFANVMVRTIQSSPAFTLRDATRPVVTIPVPPNRTSFGIPTPSFIFNVSENPVSTQCAIDNAPFIPCSSPYTAAPLLDGVHTFNVRATDPAGNTGGAGIIFSVASITIGVTPGCTDGHCPPTFTIQASRPVSHDVTVYYRMTGPGVFGIDYTVAGTFGQVVIPAGQTWASVNLIRLPGDRFVKGKTTTMRLVATPDYTVNPNHIIATVFIFRNH